MAEGDGPVNALDNALRKALVPTYPNLAKMHLVDYKVRVINSTEGYGAEATDQPKLGKNSLRTRIGGAERP